MEDAPPRDRNVILRNIIARPRLLVCIAIAGVALAIMPSAWLLGTRLLIAWNCLALGYIVAGLKMMIGADHQFIRRVALMTDEGRFVILFLACVAVAASFVAIFLQLAASKDLHGAARALHLSLAGATVLSSWFFTHIIFAQHYAHEFFIERESEKQLAEEYRSGLKFPGTDHPNYFDFLYFSFIIGVASQTADVEITSAPMRMVSLAHSLVSFFFNTTIVAFSINIASSLVG